MRAPCSTGLSHYDAPPPDALGDLDALRAQDAFRFANRLHAWAEFDGRQSGRVRAGRGGGLMGVDHGADRPAGRRLRRPWRCPTCAASRRSATAGCGSPRPRRPHGAAAAPVDPQAPVPPAPGAAGVDDAEPDPPRGRPQRGRPARRQPVPPALGLRRDGELVLKAGVADWPAGYGQPSLAPARRGATRTPPSWSPRPRPRWSANSRRAAAWSGTPTVRRLAAGDVLARQGAPGDSLYLLLDGVVDGLGGRAAARPTSAPGAVLGERALLEGGLRTATLTAVTPIRVARGHGGCRRHRDALERLAAGHRREESAPGWVPRGPPGEAAAARRPRLDPGAGPALRPVRRAHQLRRGARRRRDRRRVSCSTPAPGLRDLPGLLGGAPFRGSIVLTHLHWDHVQGLPFCPAVDRPDARRRAARARRLGRRQRGGGRRRAAGPGDVAAAFPDRSRGAPRALAVPARPARPTHDGDGHGGRRPPRRRTRAGSPSASGSSWTARASPTCPTTR